MSAIVAVPPAGESISVTSPVDKLVTIANWPSESAYALNGSGGNSPMFRLFCT